MSRSISANARAALYASQTSEIFVYLLTINDGVTTTRLCSDVEDVVSRGDTYTAFPFSVNLPSEMEGELPRIEVTLYDVNREYIATVRSLSAPAAVTIEVIMLSTPDTVEMGPWNMVLSAAEYSMMEIKLTINTKPLLTEPYPYEIFSPGKFPMLFKAVRDS